MAITQALEFDQTPNKLLFEIGEQAREQAMMRMKLQQDNMQKQAQVLQQINPATLYPKFEKEVVDQTIGGLTSGVADYLKKNPNASFIEIQSEVNKGLGDIASWSAKVKSIKEAINQGANSIGNDEPYDKGRVRAIAIDKALYKTDDLGRKVLKSPEELEVDVDYITLAKEDGTTVDPFKGQDSAFKMVKDAPLLEIDNVRTIETPDGRKTTKTGTVSKLPFYLENKDDKIVVKQGEDGYIDEEVYTMFYSNPATKAWIDSNAKDNMNKLGVPDSPEATEWFRRAYLTNWLEGQMKGELKKVNDVAYQRSINVNTGGSRGSSNDTPIVDVFGEIEDAVKNGQQLYKKKGGKSVSIGATVNQLSASAQSYIIDVANKVSKKVDDEGNKVDYTQADLILVADKNGDISVHEYPSGKKLSKLNQTQTNIKFQPTAKGKDKVVRNSAQQSGKTITKDEFAKMSIPERQKFKADGGVVK